MSSAAPQEQHTSEGRHAAGPQCHPLPTACAATASIRPRKEGSRKPSARMVPPPPAVELERDPTLSDEEARARLRMAYALILQAAQRADVAATAGGLPGAAGGDL
jgi:hypothetical protein